jgi:hypothetical protein
VLQEVLEYIHNYFIKSPNPGKYTIEGGTFSPAVSLKEGQRFWIVGSDMNDGVYTWHEAGIKDSDDINAVGLQEETFAGTICALAVPPAVIALSEEIRQWVAANSAVLNSPMQSESFNGYSYTLKSGRSQTGGDAPLTWRDIYGKLFDRWRRPCL